MHTKILPPIVLPVDIYARLERQARANERDAAQEARWLIKQALRADGQPSTIYDRAAVEAQ